MAGGDGSLHAVIAALHRRNELADAVVGLVPLGTGNDFARGVGIPLDPEEAARVVVAGNVRPVDLIVDCLGEVVVNNVHIGVGAPASHNAAQPEEGRWAGSATSLGAPQGRGATRRSSGCASRSTTTWSRTSPTRS